MKKEIPTKRGPEVVGTHEAGEIIGVPRSTIARWLHQGAEAADAGKPWPSGIIPQPIESLASGFIWKRADIERFAQERATRLAEREAEPELEPV